MASKQRLELLSVKGALTAKEAAELIDYIYELRKEKRKWKDLAQKRGELLCKIQLIMEKA